MSNTVVKRLAPVVLGLMGCLASQAAAQSLSPMKGNVVTFAEKGAVRLKLRNPYYDARRFTVDAFTLEGKPLADILLSTRALSLAPGAETSVLVVAPLEGQPQRSIYVCATSMPYYSRGNGLRGQVCGKYQFVRR